MTQRLTYNETFIKEVLNWWLKGDLCHHEKSSEWIKVDSMKEGSKAFIDKNENVVKELLEMFK